MPTPDRTPTSVRNYRFGFSPLGFVAVMIPMIPNIVWALLPGASEALAANHSPWAAVDVVGTVAQSLMIALLILLVATRRQLTAGKKIFRAVAATCLAAYLLLWLLYFTADLAPLAILMMAVLPATYFICVAVYLENYPALIPAALFTLIHVATTASNFL